MVADRHGAPLQAGVAELLDHVARRSVRAFAFQDRNSQSGATASSVAADEEVVGPLLGAGLVAHVVAHVVDEAGLECDVGIHGVEVPARVPPAEHSASDYQRQAYAELLGLGDLVVVHHRLSGVSAEA
jgi:hypothetical protein